MGQRLFGIDYPVEALGTHPMAALVKEELEALKRGKVQKPSVEGATPIPLKSAGHVACGGGELGFDARTGALTRWNGVDIGSLFKLEYATYSDSDVNDVAYGYNDYGGSTYFGQPCGSSVTHAVSPQLK